MNPDVAFSLVDRIYEAAVFPDRWQDFLADLSQAFGGATAAMALQLPGSPSPVRSYGVHVRFELEPVFERHFLRGLPWRSADKPRYRGCFVDISETYPDAELAQSDFYAEWMEPHGLAPEGPVGHTITEEDGRPVAGLALFRQLGGRRFTDDDLRLGDLLAPHLARALRLYRRFGGAQHERLALAEVMNRLAVGLVLVDRGGRPVVSNHTADRIVALNDGLTIDADRLRATNARDDAVLQQLLAEQIAREREGFHADRAMAISRPSGKRAFPLLVAPLLKGSPGDAAEDAVASVLFGDPDAKQAITPEMLRSAYDLTPAEAELVSLLAEGNSLEEAAERRGVTMNTVRTQLQKVFAKTATHRQGALIRLVLTGAAPFDSDHGGE